MRAKVLTSGCSVVCSRKWLSNRRDLPSLPVPLTAENWGAPGVRPGADTLLVSPGTNIFRVVSALSKRDLLF